MSSSQEPAKITEFLPLQSTPLTLLTNLQAIAEDLFWSSQRTAVQELIQRLKHGTPMQAALVGLQDRLPSEMRLWSQLNLSEQRWAELLANAQSHFRQRADLGWTTWISLAYPIGLTLTCLAMAWVIVAGIVPMFVPIFHDFGTELPALTLIVVTFSDLLRNMSGWPLLALLIVGIAACFGLSAVGGRRWRQSLFRSIPGIGTSFRRAALANGLDSLAMLVELDVPLPQALRTSALATDDLSIAAGFNELAHAIENGRTNHQDLDDLLWLDDIPAPIVQSILTARSSLALAQTVRVHSLTTAAQARLDLNQTWWILEPLFLVMIAGFVSLIVISLFLPLVKLLNDLS